MRKCPVIISRNKFCIKLCHPLLCLGFFYPYLRHQIYWLVLADNRWICQVVNDIIGIVKHFDYEIGKFLHFCFLLLLVLATNSQHILFCEFRWHDRVLDTALNVSGKCFNQADPT